jgi:RND family efflux transporter MFP subunit
MYAMAAPVYVVEQINPVKLKVNVSEKLFTQIKKGMEVDVKLDVYGDEVFKGKVSLVYPTIDAATRTFPVEIAIANANQRVRPGMFARVTFSYGTANHVVVPDQAVVKQTGSGDRYVYVYNNGTIEFKKVELGRRLGTEYELIGGVASGDNVVTEGHSRVVNGGKAEVVK